MAPLAARCQFSRGMLFRRERRGEDARAEIAAVRESFGAMDMKTWLARAETALAEGETS